MKVLIIEDEAPAFRRLQRILEALDPSIQILEVIDTVKDAVRWLSNHKPPDLIFMDIQLADGISFEIFERAEVNTPVIFTTAYDEYTLKAFKVNSVDYLLKPVDQSLLAQSLEKFKTLEREKNSSDLDLRAILKSIQPESKHYKERFLVKSGQKLLSIKTRDVAYFFLENGIVYLQTASGKKHAIDTPLDVLESHLNPKHFFRVNRQHLVHLDSIESSEYYDKGKLLIQVQPKLAMPLIVSRDKSSEFKRWLDLN